MLAYGTALGPHEGWLVSARGAQGLRRVEVHDTAVATMEYRSI